MRGLPAVVTAPPRDPKFGAVRSQTGCPAIALCVLVSFVTLASAPPLPERLALLIDGLRQAVAAHGARGLLTAALQVLLWSRLGRMAQRARRLAIRMAAGAPLVAPAKPRITPRAAPAKPYIRLPRGVLWLVRVVPNTAAGAASLRALLDDPAMADMARTQPMRRLLNPLCRMLGVDLPGPRQGTETPSRPVDRGRTAARAIAPAPDPIAHARPAGAVAPGVFANAT
jgi:hypothetical protein